jgi:hypothetical protein
MGILLSCGTLAMELCSRASGTSGIVDRRWFQLNARCGGIRVYRMRYSSRTMHVGRGVSPPEPQAHSRC